VGATTFGNPADTLTIASSATLDFYGSANLMNKVVDNQDAIIKNPAGNNIMAGAMTLEPGYCTFDVAGGTTLTISNVLSGSGVLYDNGDPGTLVLAGNSAAFSGGVLLYNGTVMLNGLIGSGITSQSGTTVSGSGTAEGLVDISGGFSPGTFNAGGTFNAAGGLTLESGAGLTNGLAATLGGNNDVTAVTGDLTANGNTIYINPFGGELQSGAVYPIITYTGTFNGSFAGAQTLSPSIYTFTVTNITTTTPKEIGVIVSGNPANLTWNNGSGNGQWDVLSSANWTNYATRTEGQFENGDNAIFDDSILSAASPATNVAVASGVTLLPGLVIVSNTAASYTLSGAGAIGDSASLIKTGTNLLTISMTNTYSGNTTIAAGTVKIVGQLSASKSPLGANNGSIVISNGASLVIDLVGGYAPGDAGFGAKPIIVSGAGVNGQGAIQNVGNALYDDSSTLGLGFNVTMTGDTSIGAPSRLDWGFPGDNTTLSTGGSNYNLTVTYGAGSEWDDLLMDTNLGNIDFYTYGSPETLSFDSMGLSLGNPTNVITLHSNVTLQVGFDSRYPVPAADNGYNKVIHVMNGATYHNAMSSGPGDYRDVTPFILDGGSHFYYSNGGGGNNTGTAFSGPVTLNGLAYMEIVPGGGVLVFSNVISGIGGLYLGDNGANQRPLVFAAANTYTGITDLRTNTILDLVGNGSISDSSPISLAPNTTLAVTNRTDGTLTVSSGQTLQGVGTIQGSLVASAGSLLLPGVTSTFTNVGTLTVSSNATLSGNIVMKLNNTTNDVLSAGRTLTYGGTLTLTNISGTPLAAGNSFKLFKAAGYSGAFGSITPASPGAGLSWNISNLAVSGTLSVASATGPRITSIAVSGTTLTIKANNGQANTQYVLMESTNLLTPLPWTPVLTNSFDNNGDINMSTNIINPSIPDEYFILQMQ
ncbi:MAG TPA: autotransporter-associated beta strand repeat-containing protein, partial [Verrucomicrobiae bacterium]|nr:autotransporter-associated beta strand repeat-containing protein [Verrucomicrobiae bacterium]